jgi:multidrug/hemolysin transport system permease protein
MKNMILTLIGRNLKIYFRDRVAVFFSMLSVIIVIGLFFVFLSQTLIDAITESISSISKEKISYLVNSWILGGLLSMTTLTSVLGGYGSMVSDRENNIVMGFKVSPIKAWVYPFANVMSSFIIGVIISTATLIIYSVCIHFTSRYILPIEIFFLSFAMILFSSLVNSFMLGCLCSFFKSSSAFSAASILTGTIIGFINGLYVPLGNLNKNIVSVLSAFPSLHIATIFREIITSSAINEAFANSPIEAIQEYSVKYGIVLKFNETQIIAPISIAYATILGLIGLGIMILNIRSKNRET